MLDVRARTQAAHQYRFLELLDQTPPGDAPDLEVALIAFGRAFSSGVAPTPDRAAMVRLIVAEAAHFPDPLDRFRGVGPQQQMLADRLAGYAARAARAP